MEHPDPKDCQIIASVSGGKDSCALSLHFKELGLDHLRVFADTGWEHPWTIEYAMDYLPTMLGPIDRVTSKKYPTGLAEMVRKKGMFPARLRRFCTQELKVYPLQAYVQGVAEKSDREVINAVGIRAAESAARSKFPEWEWSDSFDCWTWRPLLKWSEDDVIAIHQRHQVRPNPLYLKGARRVGCFPCIYARKSEVALVADILPERIEQIRNLEKDVGDAAEARYAKRGETLESLGYRRPTFFHSKGERMIMMPIDEYVDWAKTSRGGKQLQLHPEYDREQDGCMRWGLCDTEDEG